MKAIEGVSKIKDGYNPATWMLEVTASSQEMALEVNFANIYKNSDLFRSDKVFLLCGKLKNILKPSQISFGKE